MESELGGILVRGSYISRKVKVKTQNYDAYNNVGSVLNFDCQDAYLSCVPGFYVKWLVCELFLLGHWEFTVFSISLSLVSFLVA